MGTGTIKIPIDKAIIWYNSEDATLRDIALQAFEEKELTPDFKKIVTFRRACEALCLDPGMVHNAMQDIYKYSKASAAMFKLNIIRRTLNLGYDLHLTKDPKFYPDNRLVTEGSVYGNYVRVSGLEIIGEIKSKGIVYNVLGGTSDEGTNINNRTVGLINFDSSIGVGYATADIGFLGCATKEIAMHFGKYFGMLITQAKYADMVDFEIVEDKYGNI